MNIKKALVTTGATFVAMSSLLMSSAFANYDGNSSNNRNDWNKYDNNYMQACRMYMQNGQDNKWSQSWWQDQDRQHCRDWYNQNMNDQSSNNNQNNYMSYTKDGNNSYNNQNNCNNNDRSDYNSEHKSW